MKNFLWTLVLFNLLCLAGGFTYVILKPAEVRGALFGGGGVLETTASTSPLSGLSRRGGALTGAAEGGAESAEAGTPPPRRRPPKLRAGDLPTDTKVDTEAAFVGPVYELPRGTPPAPELYPFDVTRRMLPEAELIEVELVVLNRSGNFWKPAYVTFRSRLYPAGQMFKVESWGIDKTARFLYRFPKTELESRMDNLRIVNVEGEKQNALLLAELAKRREEAFAGSSEEHLALQTMYQDAAGAGDMLAQRRKQPIEILLPEERVPGRLNSTLTGETEAQREAKELLNQAHRAALGAQEGIVALANSFKESGYEGTMNEVGQETLERVKRDMAVFDSASIELTFLGSRTRDAQITRQEQTLAEFAEALVNLAGAVESKVRTVEPEFNITGQ